MQVRPATPADAPAIQRIAHDAWRAAYGDFLSEATLAHVRETWHTKEGFARGAESDRTTFLVAERDGEVVGYASGGLPVPEDDVPPRVTLLYVAPDHWGEGIGSRLYAAVSNALHEAGARHVEIEVFAENDRGRAFYEAKGATVVRETAEEIAGEAAALVVYRHDL